MLVGIGMGRVRGGRVRIDLDLDRGGGEVVDRDGGGYWGGHVIFLKVVGRIESRNWVGCGGRKMVVLLCVLGRVWLGFTAQLVSTSLSDRACFYVALKIGIQEPPLLLYIPIPALVRVLSLHVLIPEINRLSPFRLSPKCLLRLAPI